VLAVPALKNFRAGFPDAEITLMARPWVAGVFTDAPFADVVWSEPRPHGLRDWLRLARVIREKHFTTAVLLPNSFESAAMVFLGRIPRRVGYATDGRGWMLTDAVRINGVKKHQVDYYMELAKAVCPQTSPPSIDLEASADERARARKLLAAEGIGPERRFLVLNPGAAYGSAKRWGEDRFAQAGDALAAEFGFDAVLVGSETERSIAEHVRGLMKCHAVVLNGRTSLETLFGVIAESSLMVTNDSGPMHIAAALGVPVVAVFGSTDHTVTSPYGRRTRLVREPVDCSPCMLRECPIDHRCMTRISADMVCKAARELLGGY
jgi:heptosyltransferase-2